MFTVEGRPAVTDCTIAMERDGGWLAFRLSGAFDRAGAWKLREKIEHEGAGELLLDFSEVRDFSDLGVAVLAHALVRHGGRVLFRGLRQHQTRIFRYCGVAVDAAGVRETEAETGVERAPSPAAQEPA
jgi:anti-anti-sigma regulatory factor